MKPVLLEKVFAPKTLSILHKDSRRISKLKPKIRIIHVVDPEIIMIDAENFRETVQRLTGNKPADRGKTSISSKKVNNNVSSSTGSFTPYPNYKPIKNMLESSKNMATVQNMQKMKKEEISEGIFGEENNPNSYLSFLRDMDYLMQDMNEFPILPLKASQINMFGEMPLC